MTYVDLDDFYEGNERWELLTKLKQELPRFKVTLFTIVGRCNRGWLETIKQYYPWIDLVPHGWLHATSRECQHWGRAQCEEYLDRIADLNLTKGFKAPGWQISSPMYDALMDRGYWVADQSYNDDRRPKQLPVYIIQPNGGSPIHSIHGHIGHLINHNSNELEYLMEHILAVRDDFGFVRDAVR